MDDLRGEIAALRARMRLLTLSGIGLITILVLSAGGADLVAKTLVESDAWTVKTKLVNGTLQSRLIVTTDADNARVRLDKANLQLALTQTVEPYLASSAEGSLWYDDANNKVRYSNGTAWVDVGSGTGGIAPQVCQGRLTLVSQDPVPTVATPETILTGSTLYFTPYTGNRVSLYIASSWQMYSFTELTLSLSGLIENKTADVFLYDNAGALALEHVAWTNDTTRAVALVVQDGVKVKSGATSRRFLGTIRTTAVAAQCQDDMKKRFVINAYNRVPRPGYLNPGYVNNTASNSYPLIAGATFVPLINSTDSKFEFINLGDYGIDYVCHGVLQNTLSGGGHIAVGEDSESSPATWCGSLNSAGIMTATCGRPYTPSEGYHYLQMLGRADNANGSFIADWYANGALNSRGTHLRVTIWG
jgi:hypothetical protein